MQVEIDESVIPKTYKGQVGKVKTENANPDENHRQNCSPQVENLFIQVALAHKNEPKTEKLLGSVVQNQIFHRRVQLL